MTYFIEISDEAFDALFRPTRNHLNHNAAFDWGDGHGTLFDCCGEEMAYVYQQPSNRVWTFVSGDDGDYFLSGLHLVNRLGHLVTENSVPEGVQIQISVPESDDDSAAK